jgi:hypothetical protein
MPHQTPPPLMIYDAATGEFLRDIKVGFAGGLNIALADVNGDGLDDLVVAAAQGGLVKVFDGSSNALLKTLYPYGKHYASGIEVAAGDTDGDGRAEVVTTPASALPHQTQSVDVFNGETGKLLHQFDAGFPGGMSVALGDVNNDGRDDIIVGTLHGGTVKVFDCLTHEQLFQIEAFDEVYTGGVNVYSQDFDGDGFADILVTPKKGGNVKVYSGMTQELLTTLPGAAASVG